MHGMFDEVAYSSMFCSVLTHGAHAQRGSCVCAISALRATKLMVTDIINVMANFPETAAF